MVSRLVASRDQRPRRRSKLRSFLTKADERCRVQERSPQAVDKSQPLNCRAEIEELAKPSFRSRVPVVRCTTKTDYPIEIPKGSYNGMVDIRGKAVDGADGAKSDNHGKKCVLDCSLPGFAYK